MNVQKYCKLYRTVEAAKHFVCVWDTLPVKERLLLLIGSHVICHQKGTIMCEGPLLFGGNSEEYEAGDGWFGLSAVMSVTISGGVPTVWLAEN